MTGPGTIHLPLPGQRWQQAAPAEAQAAGVAFLARRPGGDPTFTTTLTVTGRTLSDEVDLPTLADAAVAELAATHPGARLDQRTEFGSATTPGVLQRVAFTANADGDAGPVNLHQWQVLLRTRNRDGDTDGVAALLYVVAMTGTPDDVREALPELQQFLRGITLAEAPAQ